MSKPVPFTCQHFPDYSLLSSIFLLFCLFAQEEEGSCKFSSFFCSFSDQLFFIREVRVLVNCPLFLIKFFAQGGAGSSQFFSCFFLINFSRRREGSCKFFSFFLIFLLFSDQVFLPREERVPPTQPSQRTARTGWNTSQPMESIAFQPMQMELITPPQMELQMEKWQCSSTGSSWRCWK